MQLSNVLFILLGAALLAVGVLVAALADRIRAPRAAREATPRERASRAQSAPAVIPVVESADLFRAAPAAKPIRAGRAESKVAASAESADDVIAALVGAGYKKPIATEATWACSSAERATIEDWTRAALRRALLRCARGVMS